MTFPRFAAACLFIFAPLQADEASDKDAIVARARMMIDSTLKGEMTSVLKFMHPGAVQAIGGEEVLKKAIGAVVEQMKQSGLEVVSMDVKPPDKFFPNAGKTFAVVKTKTVMQIPDKRRMTEESSMFAIQDTPGGDWTFLRVNQPIASNREILKRLLPDIPDELQIEAPARPAAEPISK